MKVVHILDGEQLALDLEDARARLRRVARALERESAARLLVSQLQSQLRHAKKELRAARLEAEAAARSVVIADQEQNGRGGKRPPAKG